MSISPSRRAEIFRRDSEIVLAIESGRTAADIAADLGIPATNVRARLLKRGISLRAIKAKATERRLTQVVTLYEQHRCTTRAAKELGIPRPQFSRWLCEARAYGYGVDIQRPPTVPARSATPPDLSGEINITRKAAKLAAWKMHVPLHSIYGPERYRRLVRARWVAILVSCEHGQSLKQTAMRLGLDHTSVLYARDNAKRYLGHETDFAAALDFVRAYLAPQPKGIAA